MVVRPQSISDENLAGSSSPSSVSAPAADGAESEWEQWKVLLEIACLCGAKQTAKYKAYNLSCTLDYHQVKCLDTMHWRKIANSSCWRINSLNALVGRSKATQTLGQGFTVPPPPYLVNRKCVSTRLVRRDAS